MNGKITNIKKVVTCWYLVKINPFINFIIWESMKST